jgi:hypothetical protein
MSTRTITLTGRPPVRISEDAWPVIASAADSEHDGQVECQANRRSAWSVRVRQHEDGRAIVYATYSYTSDWQNARGHAAKRGVMLPAATDASAICAAIREVCEDIAQAEHDGEDADRWTTLAHDCVADMPAETV